MADLRTCAILATLTAVVYVCVAGKGATPASRCPAVVDRSGWGALPPKAVKYLTIPVPKVIVIHTATQECTTNKQCAARVRSAQAFHMNERNYHDIRYSFLIGGDGNIYEGVGWHKAGNHTRGYNRNSLGIAFIGKFEEKVPDANMLTALKNLLACAVRLGELTRDYKLLAHRQVSSTASPGTAFFEEIKKMPHWAANP
ncbi:peptidoglycan-recognition protein 1-like isoform X2 [Ischnura elegans]|uniref:peptidoglycan-recognition protein 1-like isoform X2 n=1 Tax=Ischnura elegans TaxID=197161 RepID=UPI001ED87D81|nr:peptidoglycan-recognition protein 1-like isoform X2 [Ischnura elegans]